MPVQPTILLAEIAFRGKGREQSRSCENVVIPKSAQTPYPRLGRQNGIYLPRTSQDGFWHVENLSLSQIGEMLGEYDWSFAPSITALVIVFSHTW